MIYKNLSRTTKTFYGVTFKPGEAKEVSGNICHPDMIVIGETNVTAMSPTKPEKTIESVETAKSAESAKPTTTKRRKTSKKAETVEKTDTENQINIKEGVTENGTDNNQ